MTHKRNQFSLTAVIAAMVLFVSACTTPMDLLESGAYDESVQLAIKKLSGKKVKKAKYVDALEVAFAKATERDMQEANRLKQENRESNWARIHDIYQRIERRQKNIEPLLPLIDQHGLKADFLFVRVDNLEAEARENAAAYHYGRAKDYLKDAQNGDRAAARKAYAELERIGEYFRDYRDEEKLMLLARDLGTAHILVEVENKAQAYLPRRVENAIQSFPVGDLASRWNVYYAEPNANIDFDYKVVVKIADIRVNPGLVQERTYEDACEIEDGFEYVLDERGNVKKDTLGNDIKVPRKVIVRANVLESLQRKDATMQATIEFYDLQTKQMIDAQPITANALFEHYASTFWGDPRALSQESRNRIGSSPRPFPADEELLLQAAEKMKPAVKRRIADRSSLMI
ncbi:MAG: hypothetical protein HUU01_23570 [Saprospiraceae bacterium]|nr:hypothetical protein [Saprospiraceae bacterium]